MRAGVQPGTPRQLTLPWRPLAPPAPADAAVDVVVPVHGAAAATRRCLESVVAHTDLSRHRLRIVDDASPDPVLAGWLEGFAAARQATGAQVELRRHSRNRGFVASANEGLAAAAGDAVLLNSDTQVAAGWLDGLAAAACSSPDVASVTPFSNNATLCSLPVPFVANPLPPGHTVDSFAALVARLAPHRLPELPTAVGFCMYVRGEAWRAIGPFDEVAFGAGYGEENDWSLRARRAGLRHLLDDASFVFHAGGASFGGLRRWWQARRAWRVLEARWPAYRRELARFLEDRPLAGHHALLRFGLALPAGGPPRRAELAATAESWEVRWGESPDGLAVSLPRLPGEAEPAAELAAYFRRAFAVEIAGPAS